MPPSTGRTIGELSKVAPDRECHEHDGVEVALLSELAEPAPEEVEGAEVAAVDEWLLGHDRGMNGERPDAPPMEPSAEPLDVDIDDGCPDSGQSRLGALRRVSDAPRTFQKFNRHAGVWE